MAKSEEDRFHSGYVAIIGKPNVGKSTLMNCLLNRKLAIVSPKPQTTRHRILGILNGENYQIILLDTPGMIHPKYPLQQSMVKTAKSTINEADLILMMIDPNSITPEDEEIITLLGETSKPKFLIINKTDTIKKDVLLPIIDKYQRRDIFKEIVPISALKADGIELLISLILKYISEGKPFYPPDMITDAAERFFVSEIIREQIFLKYGEEIPYSTAVFIETFKERPGRKDYIRAVIYVERDSQKGIIIGKRGEALKRVGIRAREEIERFLGRPVFLELEVSVSKRWRKNFEMIKRLGY